MTVANNAEFPKRALLDGVKLLTPVLEPNGFDFRLAKTGKGSGGYYAYGAFKNGNRELKLHFRYSLGLVTYRIGDAELEHTSYMRLLNAYGQNRFPGFSKDPQQSFADLKHDLTHFCQDFLSGRGEQFRRLSYQLAEDPQMFKGLPK